jgi:threonine dehydrogenase-like Zn-dependent dehydrogenase
LIRILLFTGDVFAFTFMRITLSRTEAAFLPAFGDTRPFVALQLCNHGPSVISKPPPASTEAQKSECYHAPMILRGYRSTDVLPEVKRLTGGGADVAIEAPGTQQTFESALRSLRPGGTLSSHGVYPGKLQMPYDAFSAGLGDHRIVTTLCPGGKERMRRLVSLVQSGRFDPMPLITHRFRLDEIPQAYELFGERSDGVLKVAIKP